MVVALVVLVGWRPMVRQMTAIKNALKSRVIDRAILYLRGSKLTQAQELQEFKKKLEENMKC